MEYNVIDLKPYDIIKYFKCIYLVKDFYKNEDGRYILDYHFMTLNKGNGKLHSQNTYEIYGFHAEKIRKATEDEIKKFMSKIKDEAPDFDLNPIKCISSDETELNLDEEKCIKFLKSKGYLVYKQI